jgi:hypothetical protein
MFEQIFDQISGVFFAWLAAVLSNVEKLSSKDSLSIFKREISKRTIACLLIAISTIGLVWQTIKAYRLIQALNDSQKVVGIESARLFNEASGGAVIGNFAYLVDDESPTLFRLQYNPAEKKYHYNGYINLINDAKKIVEKNDIDDLEAAAGNPAAPGKIYLMTSHSNTKGGKIQDNRQRFLEVSLDDGVITNEQDNLRKLILDKFQKIAKEQGDHDLETLAHEMEDEKTAKTKRIGGMQIEGLAIDANGNAYLGFREPLIRKDQGQYALVLRAKLTDMLQGTPNFESFFLPLKHEKDNYGIASIDYDSRTNSLLILGSDPQGEWLTPVLWQWRDFTNAKADEIAFLTDRGNIKYDRNNDPSAKPELILLPPAAVADDIFMFLDTDGKSDGGQIKLDRTQYSLAGK